MRLSDEITAYILDMLEQAQNGSAVLQRNELAEEIGCVPSQINYVLSTRFSPENGYIVESRRGGGGYIRISRVDPGSPSLLMHTVVSLGNSLDAKGAQAIVKNLFHQGELSKREAAILLTILQDSVLGAASPPDRNALRARMLKYALLAAAGNS